MIESVAPSDLASDRVWRQLEAKLRPFVAKRVRAVDVDDVVQEVFVRIQRGLPGLRDDQRFGPWVYQIARSAIGDYGRIAARHPHADREPQDLPDHRADGPGGIGDLSSMGGVSGIGDSGDSDDGRAVTQQVAQYAALFVSLLPSPYREALTLTELEGLTQKQAADMLGISLSGMKSRVQRGRHKVRTALEECCDIALDARRRVISCTPRPDGKLPAGCCT